MKSGVGVRMLPGAWGHPGAGLACTATQNGRVETENQVKFTAFPELQKGEKQRRTGFFLAGAAF
jgi:hypothetical protein